MAIEMIGKRFGRLIVIQESTKTKDGHKRWLCECNCGNFTIVDGRDLRATKVKSCGCLLKEMASTQKHHLKHGNSKNRLYIIWQNMLDRCRRINNSNYKNYGGRGIKICKEWLDYPTFKTWAINNGYKENLTIDRIDVNGNYEPNNCRWATMKEQANNKRNNRYLTYNGETHTISEWSKIVKIDARLLSQRLNSKWSLDRALSEKPFIGKNQYFLQKRY